MEIIEPKLLFNNLTGSLSGAGVQEKYGWIRDLEGLFADETTRRTMDQDQLVYKVQFYFPVAEGTEGGLFFGNTTIFPGKVGNEYFMSKGHFHAKSDRGEYYWGISGVGVLVFMDRNRRAWAEKISPGSLHYLPAHTAHRTVNTGNEPMTFGACWPSDAGHDYGTIIEEGFSARLVEKQGKPVLIKDS